MILVGGRLKKGSHPEPPWMRWVYIVLFSMSCALLIFLVSSLVQEGLK